MPLYTYCGIIEKGCDHASECRTCPEMQKAIKKSRKDYPVHNWLCHDCMRGLRDSGKDAYAPGYYTEGKCEAKKCVREDRHTFLLQLVLFGR